MLAYIQSVQSITKQPRDRVARQAYERERSRGRGNRVDAACEVPFDESIDVRQSLLINWSDLALLASPVITSSGAQGRQ